MQTPDDSNNFQNFKTELKNVKFDVNHSNKEKNGACGGTLVERIRTIVIGRTEFKSYSL